MRSWLWIFILLVLVAKAGLATAQSPQIVPAYPLYCAGPLNPVGSPVPTVYPYAKDTVTAFRWAPSAAATRPPGPGQCAWVDRTPRGLEILAGGANKLCDFSGAMQSVPAGTFIEVGVIRDPQVGNCMHVTRYIGPVSPPFSAAEGLAPFTRPSIANMSPQQIESMRRGFAVMMQRPPSDPTSYRFQADIHGTGSDRAPNDAVARVWDQCQHYSYFFLSWHRMYLYFFDRILRAAAQDPTLVLPYWDWTDPNQRKLPLPFRSPADSSNSLFITTPGRPDVVNSGEYGLDGPTVDIERAFQDLQFETDGSSSNGFGGKPAPPSQLDDVVPGDFENLPHDTIHTALGGPGVIKGLMGIIPQAAEDPIFWLHHANIDRLWNKWLAQGDGRADPPDAAWLNTPFTFYDEAGHAVLMTGAQIVNSLQQLNYRYDVEPSKPLGVHVITHLAQSHDRTQRIGEAAAKPAPVHPQRLLIMSENRAATDDGRVLLHAAQMQIALPLPVSVHDAVRAQPANVASRWYLQLSDIRTAAQPGFFYAIYLASAADAPIDIQTPGFIGVLTLLSHHAHGTRDTSMPSEVSSVRLDVTSKIASLVGQNASEATVVLVPHTLVNDRGEMLPLPEMPAASVGKVQLLRVTTATR